MTKNEILKMTGLKERDFYKVYDTEEKFIAKYGKKIRKAEIGTMMASAMSTGNNAASSLLAKSNKMGNFNSYLADAEEAPMGIESWMTNDKAFGNAEPKQDKLSMITKGMPIIGDIAKGIGQITQGHRELERLNQWKGVTGVMRQAAELNPQIPERKYLRPDDPENIYNVNNFYPSGGVGTNPLAKKGGKIPKAYAGMLASLGKSGAGTSGFAKGVGSAIDFGGLSKISSGITSLTGESGGDTLGGTIGGTEIGRAHV